MLRLGALYSVRRHVRLELDGHISLLYVDAECASTECRMRWETFLNAWISRMSANWEEIGSACFLVDEQESRADYGILDIKMGSSLRECLYRLVADSTSHWLCRVPQRPRLHLSFGIPTPAIAVDAVLGLAVCPELQLMPAHQHPSSLLPARLVSNLDTWDLTVTCVYCGSVGPLRLMLQCVACRRLVCYATCAKIVCVRFSAPPY